MHRAGHDNAAICPIQASFLKCCIEPHRRYLGGKVSGAGNASVALWDMPAGKLNRVLK
jgi:hypothetical protein